MTFQKLRDRANRVRGIPLQDVLLLGGATRDRYDSAKWHTEKGTISCTGMKFMNWHHMRGGGGAIDLAMHLNDMDFKAAVQWLCCHFPHVDYLEQNQPPCGIPLTLPEREISNLPAIRRYLVQERALPASLIQNLIESGALYADSRCNAVFVLLGKENIPVGAELRGTTPGRWRGMAPGSKKDLGYFSVPAPRASTVVLCESAIDAISCFTLHPGNLCISTSGTRPDPRWLPLLITQGYEIYCGFDSDSTGETLAGLMMAHHPTIKRLRPLHHDWNDALKAHITAPPSA
jgi:hypothetical protein